MYKNEMSVQDHINLLRQIKESKSMVIISGYDSDLYNSQLEGWRTDEIVTTAQFGLRRIEKIWMNY